jgi:deoxyribodipyrimidine photo-lyase
MRKMDDIQGERIRALNSRGLQRGEYVLYWMQSSVRTEYNHALEYSVERANALDLPLLVFFGVTDKYPNANLRHYRFLLEGLEEVKGSLEDRKIGMLVQHVSPEIGAISLSGGAAMTVVDVGYTRELKAWSRAVAERVGCPLVQVESNIVVPVEAASVKEEYSAATIRPKITKKLSRYLVPLRERDIRNQFIDFDVGASDFSNPVEALDKLEIDRSVGGAETYRGGTGNAKRRLDEFIDERLDAYAESKNDPTKDAVSNLSPYLHFGHISPLHVALEVDGADSPGKESFLEELIVRRELAINFVNYNEDYDTFECLPDWCKKTLSEHASDPREYTYSLAEFERAETHDPYWNAAQTEMVKTGKMHGYMRMYWGKKILEWSRGPEEAYGIAVRLNDKYELDGRDPNGYAGVAWCFGKHDRPWKERPVFGKIRYMNDRGLRRKFDADLYIKKVSDL